MRYALWKMYLRLDPWATEYNTAYHAEDVSNEAKANVDAYFERAAADWQAIKPQTPNSNWNELIFLDGSRRVEARVLLEDDKRQAAFGALGSYGVGAVSCCPERSRPARVLMADNLLVTERICALGSGQQLDNFSVKTQLASQLGEFHYRVISTAERDAEAVVRRLQTEMREAEKHLASRLLNLYPEALIICDGPRPYLGSEVNVIGYVKTIHEPRLGQRELDVVRRLNQGERSPIYLVKNSKKEQQYFEWFFRLRDPNPWLYSLAGMVRLQAYAGSEPESRLKEVQQLADWLAGQLPRFASRQHQDPRAPQQLLPIRALEAELSRRMGHPQIVRRRLTQFLSEQGG